MDGGGTAQLALGLLERPNPNDVALHSYDRFKINNNPVENLQKGDDTLPWVKRQFELIENEIDLHFHKGDILETVWAPDMPISVYVDDASKDKFIPVLQRFGAAMIPGQTVLVLMDYYYFRKPAHDEETKERFRVQERFITQYADSFRNISSPLPAGRTSTAAFLYLGGVDFDKIEAEQ